VADGTPILSDGSSIMDNANLEKVIFTFVDVETTGLNPSYGDRICEIGLLRWKDGEELASFQSLVNPGRPISPGAQAVNNITDAMVADAPSFEGIADRALALMEGTVLVAHNAPFDMSFLNMQLALLRKPELDNRVIDTLALARSQYDMPSNSLGSLRLYMGLAPREEHRAMGDVLILRDVFVRMMKDLKGRGVETLEDLVEAQRRTRRESCGRGVMLPPEIEEAIGRGARMRIRYLSGNQRETERVIRPLEVEVLRDTVYLVAYCYLRKEERTFRMDRIVEWERVD